MSITIKNVGGHVETITPLSFYHFWSMRRLLRRLRRTIKHFAPLYESLAEQLKKIEEDESLGNEEITEKEMNQLAETIKSLIEKLNELFKKALEEEYDNEKEEEEIIKAIPLLYQEHLHLPEEEKQQLVNLLSLFEKAMEDYEEKVLFEEEKGFKIAELDRETFLQYIQGLRNDAMMFAQMLRDIRDERDEIKEEEKLIKNFKEVIHHLKKEEKDPTALRNALKTLEEELKAIIKQQQKEILLLHDLVHKTFILYFHLRKYVEKVKEIIEEIKKEGFNEARAQKIVEAFQSIFDQEKTTIEHYLAMVYYLKNKYAHEKALLEKEKHFLSQAA